MWVVVEHEGKSYRVAVSHSERGTWVAWPGGSTLIPRHDPKMSESEAAEAANFVHAPMTARVVQVRAVAGNAVAEDELLVVLEAMKMEYRLTAPRAGTVDEVRCQEGELVDLGAILVTLKQ